MYYYLIEEMLKKDQVRYVGSLSQGLKKLNFRFVTTAFLWSFGAYCVTAAAGA